MASPAEENQKEKKAKKEMEKTHRRVHLVQYKQDGFLLDSREATDVVEMCSRGAELKRVGHVHHVNYCRRIVQVLQQ